MCVSYLYSNYLVRMGTFIIARKSCTSSCSSMMVSAVLKGMDNDVSPQNTLCWHKTTFIHLSQAQELWPFLLGSPSVDPPPIELYSLCWYFLCYVLSFIMSKFHCNMCHQQCDYTVYVGELFDHGLDSWSCILLPLTLFSAIGTGTKYGGSTEEMLVPCLGK